MSDAHAHSHGDHGHGEALPGTIGHVTSAKTLVMVFLTLVLLTVITVAAAQVDVGRLNVVGALAIAVVKGSIVCLWFMHLRYDKRFNFFIMLGSVLTLLWMVGYILFDTKLYQHDMENYRKNKTVDGKVKPE
ncbi:MAG: cytochrome C oxidase subunit IV family protein [Planctomycetes bacterium]|jgi:cytochrome c oxidase subunit 4|nr:cytochrome C oxidase subunit IV family protein [Planctomycetota bacterium]MCL4729989.1 cytochrome C oxidase subunit IV family protein [Planctomycetota bacterium]